VLVKDSDKRGMPEYRKTLWEAITRGVRLSRFYYYPDLLDRTQSRGEKGDAIAARFYLVTLRGWWLRSGIKRSK
jgi:hypothetical protein